MPTPQTRVIVVESDPRTRWGTRTLLTAANLEIVGMADSAATAWEVIDLVQPDAVVTNARLHPTYTREGIALARQLRRTADPCGVVVISRGSNPHEAMQLLEHGAQGVAYVVSRNLDNGSSLLARAIREVAAGGMFLDPEVVDVLFRNNHRRRRVDELTPREREVLELVAQGKSNSSIAQALGLSCRAVEKHISSIYTTLSLGDDPDRNRRVSAVLRYLSRQEAW